VSAEKPWEDYPDPLARDAAPAEQEGVGYGEDIVKGAAGGLGRGVSGTLGLPGTIGGLYRKGLSKIGVPDEYLDMGAKAMRLTPFAALAGPDATQVKEAIESQTGKFYEPKTIPGQYMSTFAEFAPGALIPGGGGAGARLLNTATGALASETAGQITKGTAAEPWARGIAGAAAPLTVGKIVTPAAPATRARQEAVGVLEREGIPVTAGQRTGSKPIQWAESVAADMPGSAGRAGELFGGQRTAFDRAMTNRTFDRGELRARGVPDDVNLPDASVRRHGGEALSDEYTRLTQNDLRSNPQLQNRMTRALGEYERRVLPSQRTPAVEQTRNDIVDKLVAQGGRMPGDEYQAIRSQIGESARAPGINPQQKIALREYKYALDEAMQAGLSPADAAAWARNNLRYANMKTLDPAIASAGENLSPARVAQAVRSGRNSEYASQRGNLDELADAAALVMKDLPQSGTGPRTAVQQLFNAPTLLSTGGGGLLGTMFGGPIGAAIGIGAPLAAARGVVSRPGQAYLANQAIPQHAREAIAQALLQQAISQPSGVERNAAEQEAYDKEQRERR
jgi:hypothetical protein